MDGTLRVWDLESGACLHIIEGGNDDVDSVRVTPDGRRAVSTVRIHPTLRVWDLDGGACLHTLMGHCNRGAGVCMSMTPDGRYAVSGSNDCTLRVWDLGSGACLRTLEGHSHTVGSVGVTPDG